MLRWFTCLSFIALKYKNAHYSMYCIMYTMVSNLENVFFTTGCNDCFITVILMLIFRYNFNRLVLYLVIVRFGNNLPERLLCPVAKSKLLQKLDPCFLFQQEKPLSCFVYYE